MLYYLYAQTANPGAKHSKTPVFETNSSVFLMHGIFGTSLRVAKVSKCLYIDGKMGMSNHALFTSTPMYTLPYSIVQR